MKVCIELNAFVWIFVCIYIISYFELAQWAMDQQPQSAQIKSNILVFDFLRSHEVQFAVASPKQYLMHINSNASSIGEKIVCISTDITSIIIHYAGYYNCSLFTTVEESAMLFSYKYF